MRGIIRVREVAYKHNPSQQEPLKGLTAQGKTPGTPITGAKPKTMVLYQSTYNKKQSQQNKTKKKAKKEPVSFIAMELPPRSQIRNSQTVNFFSD